MQTKARDLRQLFTVRAAANKIFAIDSFAYVCRCLTQGGFSVHLRVWGRVLRAVSTTWDN